MKTDLPNVPGQLSRIPVSTRIRVCRALSAERWLTVPMLRTCHVSALFLVALFPFGMASAQESKTAEVQRAPIPITQSKREDAVDFEKDILPVLKNNCLACHNQTKAKADLVLETPQTILKGGESGPAVLPGKSGESLLLKVASHQNKPNMPPKDNKVNAVDLTPEQLGLIKLWIDQGAKGEVHAQAPMDWEQLPETINPIYAVALTRDGQFAACSRANQIFVYHVPSGQLAQRLADPKLLVEGEVLVDAQKPSNSPPSTAKSTAGEGGSTPRPSTHKTAHLDLVHSLAFSPEGDLLASGGYREVKLWRRPKNVQKLHLPFTASNGVQSLAPSVDGRWLATASADGRIHLFD